MAEAIPLAQVDLQERLRQTLVTLSDPDDGLTPSERRAIIEAELEDALDPESPLCGLSRMALGEWDKRASDRKANFLKAAVAVQLGSGSEQKVEAEDDRADLATAVAGLLGSLPPEVNGVSGLDKPTVPFEQPAAATVEPGVARRFRRSVVVATVAGDADSRPVAAEGSG